MSRWTYHLPVEQLFSYHEHLRPFTGHRDHVVASRTSMLTPRAHRRPTEQVPGLVVAACLILVGCSTAAENTTPPNVLAGLAAGSGRLAGRVGPGRPGEDRPIPALTLTFSDGKQTVETTVHDGRYTLDLPPGTWEVHSGDGTVCATGLRVVAAALQGEDLSWPGGACQDLSGPPAQPSPPAGPSPPGG